MKYWQYILIHFKEKHFNSLIKSKSLREIQYHNIDSKTIDRSRIYNQKLSVQEQSILPGAQFYFVCTHLHNHNITITVNLLNQNNGLFQKKKCTPPLLRISIFLKLTFLDFRFIPLEINVFSSIFGFPTAFTLPPGIFHPQQEGYIFFLEKPRSHGRIGDSFI